MEGVEETWFRIGRKSVSELLPFMDFDISLTFLLKQEVQYEVELLALTHQLHRLISVGSHVHVMALARWKVGLKT